MEFSTEDAEPQPQPQPQPQSRASGLVSAAEPPPPASDTGADAGSEAPVNPRKRKKASRACDFCHVNHQPCDNGKPKCSVCVKHNKPCLYLRPTKRRGPQKGYRTALNTYKESAAAWGAVLGAIPGLDALIEGHLHSTTGKAVVASIKDGNQQDALITQWQDSSVFRAFFGHNGPPPNSEGQGGEGATNAQSLEADDDDLPEEQNSDPPIRSAPAKRHVLQSPALLQRRQSPSRSPALSAAVPVPAAVESKTPGPHSLLSPAFRHQSKVSNSLSDIVAKDAAQGSSTASRTLASLGFAPDETIADFYSMGSNPEPISQLNDQEFDPALGSELEQKAYYELLMGRSFPA